MVFWRADTLVSVISFGAVGDGVTDDTTAIQAALTALSPGTALYFPAGSAFKVTSQLTISNKSNFSLVGNGAIINFDSTVVPVSHNIAALQITGCTNFKINGIRFIQVNQTQQYNGLNITSGTNGVVSECSFYNFRWVGVGAFDATPGTTKNVVFDSNTIEYCRYGVSVNGQWMRITNNLVADYWLSTSEASVPWVNTSIYWDAIILGAGTSESEVSNNIIVEPGQSGIYGGDAISKITISGNTILRPQNKGVDIGPPTNSATYITVVGNTVIDAATGWIHFFKVNYGTITGNTVSNTGALYFGAAINKSMIILNDTCIGNVINGNDVLQPSALSGIFVNASGTPSTNNLISMNNVQATTKYSIDAIANQVIDTAEPYIGVSDGLFTAGQETLDRRVFTGLAGASASGQLRLAYFTARKSETITQVRTVSGAAAGATPTLVRIGIYSVAANGDLTLIASTPNDTTLYATANTVYTKALTASFNTVKGTRYAIGILVVTAAALPTLVGLSGASGMASEHGLAPRAAGFVAAADLPSTQTEASLSNSLAYWYVHLIP